MKSFLVVVWLFSIIVVSGCSKKCALPIEQAPEIRGFKLGDNFGDLIRRFEGLPSLQQDEFGLNWFLLQPDSIDQATSQVAPKRILVNVTRYSELADVDYVRLDFVDDKLAKFKLRYKNQANWTDLDAFITQISHSLKITGGWEAPEPNKFYKVNYKTAQKCSA